MTRSQSNPPGHQRLNTDKADQSPTDDAVIASEPGSSGDEGSASQFVVRWNRVISQTNWEKGRIICQWRETMHARNAPVEDYSDEIWRQMVGDITAQHVGRLRRTYDRFGETFSDYPGLYWSHFYAALDWDDAEMWLEGAIQNSWSISQMRSQRWETLGGHPEQKPRPEDVVMSEPEEGLNLAQDEHPHRDSEGQAIEGPRLEGPDFGDDPPAAGKRETAAVDLQEKVKPSLELTQILDTITDPPEHFVNASLAMEKSVIRLREDQWKDVSKGAVMTVLNAIRKAAAKPVE